jgi:anti-anti-sigma factor
MSGASFGGDEMALLTFTRTFGPALVLELHGSLDNAAAEKLAPRVWEILDQGQRLLIFDLAKLTYVSSAGLTVFLGAYRRLQGIGQVRFAGLPDTVHQVFSVTGLAVRLELYPTVQDALVGPLP